MICCLSCLDYEYICFYLYFMIPVTGNAFSWSVVIGIGGGILETFILEEWILDTSLDMENSFSSSKS